jgi:hypothetical protein
MKAYKLFTLRKDGSLGPLFINRRLRVPMGKWMKAETHPTRGFAVRSGWHCTARPEAPHLSLRGRIWCEVDIRGVTEYNRPESQGGLWFTARSLRVVRIMED